MKRILKCLSLVGILMLFFAVPAKAETIAQKFSGRIFLQVESKGEAWYINPADLKRCYLGRPEDAFKIMRELAIGISNKDLDNLPVAGDEQSTIDKNLLNRLLGKIVLQVEDKGQAYYIDPVSKEAIYLGRPKDAFEIMRGKGTGISNENLEKVNTNPKYAVTYNPVVVSGDNNTVSNNSNNTTTINNTTNITNNSTAINNSGDNNSTQVNQNTAQTTTPSSPSNNTQSEAQIAFSHLADLESSSLAQGISNRILLAFKVSSDKLIKLNGLKITHAGTGSSGDIINLGLYEYSSGAILGSKISSFDNSGIASFQSLNKTVNGETTIVLKGDVSENAVGNKTHVFKILTDSHAEFSSLADVSNLPIESKEVTVQSTISINVSRSSVSPSGNVYAGTTNASIAEFSITASGENIKITQLSLVVKRSGTANADGSEYIKNGKILLNDVQVGATKNIKVGDENTLAENGTVFTFGSTAQIPKGQTYKMKVVADITAIGTALANNDTLKVIVLGGSNNAQGVLSGITASTNYSDGNAITVKQATISVAKYSGFGNHTMTAGSANAKLAMFVLSSTLTEESNLKSVEFKAFNYAADYGTLVLKKYNNSQGGAETDLCTVTASSASNFTCTLASPLRLTGTDIFSVYANQISTTPQSVGLDSYQGLVISKVSAMGTVTGIPIESSGETILQNLAIAPLN